jgi:putative FmdB family regulatory protein
MQLINLIESSALQPIMPIYEYHCDACGHEFEALQKLSESLLVKCPSCGQEKLRKLLSAAGFQLKGSGWYQTDFRSSGSKPAEKAGASSDGDNKAEKKSAGKADEKSAASTEGASTSKADAKSDAGSSSAKTETKAAPASTPKTESKSSAPPGSAT